MRYLPFFVLAFLAWTNSSVHAQSSVDSTAFKKAEIKMRDLVKTVLTQKDSTQRVHASIELQAIVQATFSQPSALHYPFEVNGLSIQIPEDKSFALITWQLFMAANDYRYKGILAKASPEKNTLFILNDDSPNMLRGSEFYALDQESWYGALYYNLQPFVHKGQPMYLLFGYDAFATFEHRKLIDVLSFDKKGRPVFGAPVLEIRDAYDRPKKVFRYLLQYSASGSIRVNYDPEQDMVLYENLILAAPVEGQGPSNVGDGSYCGLKLNKEGIWEYVDKVFHLNSATPPSPHQMEGDKNRDIFGRRRRRQ